VSADPAAAAPSGVVTFLFTDVEGSTRRWEADAEGMRAALAAHDEVLCGAIEEHGGWLFKHTGDRRNKSKDRWESGHATGLRRWRPSVGRLVFRRVQAQPGCRRPEGSLR
jgi:hypothetical protein